MAGEHYPFILTDRITFGAAGTGTLDLVVGATEEFIGEEIFFIVSSGTFSIIAIKDSAGKPYTNADASNPLTSALFLTTLDQRQQVGKFSTPLQLVPNTHLFIEVTGGSDTATLDAHVKGKKRAIA